MMRFLKYLNMSILMAAVTLSCRQETRDAGTENGRGSLLLTLSSEPLSTKAGGEVADGDAFENILVLMCNEANQVVAKNYQSYGEAKTFDNLYFKDLKVGTYHVYAYANVGHVQWQQGDQTIENVEKQLAADLENGGATLDDSREMAGLSGSDVPAIPSTSMLLTGHTVLAVGSRENLGQMKLLRPVSRLNVYLHNHTDYDVTLESLSFSDFNPSRSYLVAHWDDDGVPQLPSGNTYRPLPAFEGPCDVPPGGGEAPVYSTLLYENACEEEYRIFASISSTDEVDFTQTRHLTDGGRLIKPEEVLSMAVGDTREVLLVNPNSNNGAFFGWSGNTAVKTVAKFTSEDGYRALAKTILTDISIRNNYIYTLKRVENDTDGSKLYTLTIGTNNIFYANGTAKKKDGAFVEAGSFPVDKSYPISSDFDGYLFHFRTDAWNHPDYFRNDNSNKPYYNDQTNKTEYINKGNFQWAMYDINTGAVMRLIDNKTAQVSELRAMKRNQELNVVLNVYFEAGAHTFDFSVDNTYWTDGHHPTHIFQ